VKLRVEKGNWGKKKEREERRGELSSVEGGRGKKSTEAGLVSRKKNLRSREGKVGGKTGMGGKS